MGEHSGAVTVYRAPRGRWHELLLGSGGTFALYGVTLLGLASGPLLVAYSFVGAVALGAAIVALWSGLWMVRRMADQVRIGDRYHWDRARRAGTAVMRFLPATGLLEAGEVRAVVRHELREIVDLLVEQERLVMVQRGARRAARELPDGEPVRRELDEELGALDGRVRDVASLVEARIARLVGLAAEAEDLATLEARRGRARQAAARVREELSRPSGYQPVGEAVERAEAILAAYRALKSTVDSN
jgi:hypothetical protein